MSKPFIYLYDWFERHKIVFRIVLVLSVVLCAATASRISLQEDITSFFNSSDKNRNAVFENIKVKDKIIVMLSGDDPDAIIQSAEIFEEKLQPLYEERLIDSITAYADEDTVNKCADFIYDYLPIFLNDEDYERLERQLTDEGIEAAVRNVYGILASPSGMIVQDMVVRDPLGIGTHLIRTFERFKPDLQYEIYGGRLFTNGLTTMLMFIEPSNGMGDTGNNDKLVSLLDAAEAEAEIGGVDIECIGGPIVAVYNARQIKKDTSVTLSIALIFILAVLFLSFRDKRSIPLIIIPPIFGALFALGAVWLIQGTISAIAIGAGTVVLGISLSYSMHIISHLNYISSPREIIEELAAPLTTGCFTTIGAFAALIFTSSALLRDMGLFSVFALTGTTLFCLIFLPHFLAGFDTGKNSRLLNKIEHIAGYRYDGNKLIVLPIVIATVAALFFYRDVEFDNDISNINYIPRNIIEAEARSEEIFGDGSKEVYIVTGNSDPNVLTAEYSRLEMLLDSLVRRGDIESAVSIGDMVIPPQEQRIKIERWNDFWDRHRTRTLSQLSDFSRKYGFRDGAFDRFGDIITREYTPCYYTAAETGSVPIISEWINASNGTITLLSRITIDDEHKAQVYEAIDKSGNSVAVDRKYFSSKIVEATSNDFNYILLVSSLIVFITLLLSYGRLELTLLTFLPMCISWVIILGLMAVCDIKFNIVNIILATFIFGIGDDFSIFIMDGLMQEYKNGKKVLGAHKTAIFFSAFTAAVGMGVLIFAQHPALKSIALISVSGLSVVVFVSYTVQPMLFRLFVSSQTERGEFPYTISSILNTAYCFIYFLAGCISLQIYMLAMMPLPMKRKRKKQALHNAVYRFTRLFLRTMITVRTVRENPYGETYEKPAVIIANHQSFIDILLLLSTSPKIVMVTNGWVWNSPFFGRIVRYADFRHSADGYEALAEGLRDLVADGYSVVIFPEGTRSEDCSIRRFHKGAFYLAQLLQLDILPVIIYGAGQVSSKNQGFYIKSGIIAAKTMQRIKYGDTSFGTTYQTQAKNIRQWYIEQYRAINDKFGRTDNPYFRDAIIKNYIYKGPVLEWYMRIKCRMDNYYDLWDRIIPRNAAITDVGCGYGQLSFMLGMLSPERRITGIDYDKEKTETAAHSFLSRRTNVRFLCEDMRTAEFPDSDAILFNDCLHYVGLETQTEILKRAAKSLNKGGVIIIRDGDVSGGFSHNKIMKTELWSTKILRFNKTSEPLVFASSEHIERFARDNGLHIRIKRCDKESSETLYILRATDDGEI